MHIIRSKIKIINYAKIHNQKNSSIKYFVPESTISDWMKNEKKYLNVSSNKLTNTTLHKGLKLLYPEVEIKLIQFIEFIHKLFN